MTASPEQLHAAFTYCRDFAKLMLEKAGSFHPFGATINLEGEVAAAAGWTGDEHPQATELIQLLTSAFYDQAQSNAILGAAIAVDVNMPSSLGSQWPDGIRIHLEGESYARNIYVPYAIKFVGLIIRKREVLLADPIPVKIPPEIF